MSCACVPIGVVLSISHLERAQCLIFNLVEVTSDKLLFYYAGQGEKKQS